MNIVKKALLLALVCLTLLPVLACAGAGVSYEAYWQMTVEEQKAFLDTFENSEAAAKWYENRQAVYEKQNPDGEKHPDVQWISPMKGGGYDIPVHGGFYFPRDKQLQHSGGSED